MEGGDGVNMVPSDRTMAISIDRTLVHWGPGGKRREIGQDEIMSLEQPVVILGDPGMGKSTLTQRLGQCSGMTSVQAGTFARSADPGSLLTEGERIVIDGLDEIASSVPGGAVDTVLKQLSAMGRPSFILTCREADWRGATDRVEIEQEYGEDVLLLHLQPFTRNDAREFLLGEFPEVNAERVLDHVTSCGLEDIYRNPLTLRMLGENAQGADVLPDGRAELFERACQLMLRERNERHQAGPHAHRSEDELLLAAGAICATQLLCDASGVYVGSYMETPDSFVNVADIEKLRLGKAARDVLRVRLFRAEGEQRFTHIHRVFAEYLGAMWLAQCFEEGVSERRLFGLFRQGDSVPTSLRGLHAWIAHFSAALAESCIAADPYAVLRYGDAETLSLEEARALLNALKKLSEEDPYFRSEDWGRHRVSGLMRSELREEIVGIIGTHGQHVQLRALLLEAMAGSKLVTKLIEALDEIMVDSGRYYHERTAAADAIRLAGNRDDWDAIINRLLKLGDADSARLACELIHDVGASAVANSTSVDAVFAHLGLSVSRFPQSDSELMWNLRRGLFSDLHTDRLCMLLDEIGDRARLLTDDSDYPAREALADIVRRLTADVLECEPSIEPERIWGWIGWLARGLYSGDEANERLAGVFHKNRALRTELLEHVLLTPCGRDAFVSAGHLMGMGLDLYPREEDIAALLNALRVRAGDGRIDPDKWRVILCLRRTSEGIPAVVRDAAREAAQEDSELLAVLADLESVVEAPWEKEQAERKAKANEERRQLLESRRAIMAARLDDIVAGDFRFLRESADVYVGRIVGFDRNALPRERLREFLGEPLCDSVLAGFIALLGRDDLPSAAEIANAHCESKCWNAELPMICGIAEMIRLDRPIHVIDRDTLSAVYMAWQRAHADRLAETVDMGAAMEAVLFRNEADIETHFRTSIEPQLANNIEHPAELYRLVNEPKFAKLSGRLAVEWLREFLDLAPHTQWELLNCALANGSRDAVEALLEERRAIVAADDETRRLWLSADFMMDFDNCKGVLRAEAGENPEFIWALRDRIAPERGKSDTRLSLRQQVFIVEGFGISWPQAEWPTGTVMGSENPWDASDLIGGRIYAIAQDPSPDATEALDRLIHEGHAPTYVNALRHALSLQRKARRDREYSAPSVGELQAIVADGLPETVDDMRAYFADHLDVLQKRIRGSNTDMWQTFWSDEWPRDELFCRDRLIDLISGRLPASIRFEPERHMPRQKRADIAAIRNTIGLPVEIKGQWHSEVWDAACEQLDAKYTCDWQAEGRGAYIVQEQFLVALRARDE